jgi:hypothetical protein
MEFSVLSGQCLDRRIPDKQTLIEEVAAWEKRPQQEALEGRVATHLHQCTHQAEAAIPGNMSDSGH